jgi:molybdopterin/thiamine biosynthesis adenylyltransferase
MVSTDVTYELVIAGDSYLRIHQHLFQPDRDEHAAVVLAGVHRGDQRTRLLARETHLVSSEHFVPGTHGYRQTAPRLVAELATRAASESLAYVALHSHPGAHREVSLSRDDRRAHERLFPHLLNLLSGAPVAGIALGHESAAGEVWLKDQRPEPLAALRVIGHRLLRLTSGPRPGSRIDPRFDRQVRLFGEAGQEILRGLHVGVVGAGGGGSIIVQQLAHLGVGAITAIDFDVVKDINLSRIVGATARDVGAKKVAVLARLVHETDPSITLNTVDGDIADLETAELLLDTDFIFLAADTITSRLVFNAIVHRFLIPGVQIGAKVDSNARGEISQVYVAVRPVLPNQGCLHCNSLIDPMKLQEESRTDEERAAQNYLDEPELIDPSVISLNAVAASHAVNVMLFATTGLADTPLWEHRLILPRSGEVLTIRTKKDPECPFCSMSQPAVFGRGDPTSALPCRRSASPAVLGRHERWRQALRRVLERATRRRHVF